MLEFISENKLGVFSKNSIRASNKSIFKTSDARTIFTRVIEKLGKNFIFYDTENLFSFFEFTESFDEIKKRQEFFKNLEKSDNSFLRQLVVPKATWKPKYEVMVVTENEKTFMNLNQAGCPVRFVSSADDVSGLDNCDIIQAIDCEECKIQLESLPQSIFLDSEDEVYLERYLEQLSGWKKNLEILNENKTNPGIQAIVSELYPLLRLIDTKNMQKLDEEKIDLVLENINLEVSSKIKELSISGDSLFELLSRSKLPVELEKIVEQAIRNSNIPEHLFTTSIPVKADEHEVENFLRLQNSNEFTNQAEKIKSQARSIKQIPEKLRLLENLLLIYDFEAGIAKYFQETNGFSDDSEEFIMENSRNMFLENPQPVTFNLTANKKCSILTGANSGGKTTLLEHVIQLISLLQLGLPVSGKVKMPLFQEIYYFAKNKGSMSKGAFETMLTQLSKIKPGKKTLILADEMEAVTEPGTAGSIICATAEFFLGKNCFLIIASHLGQEIKNHLPMQARIDGIEAKGLDDNFELIVDHNPVMGRLASSTPELIVEKLASTQGEEYFKYLHQYLKSKKV